MFTACTRSQAVEVGLEDRGVVGGGDAGVVVEDVDAAEPLGGGEVHALDGRLVRDVHLHGEPSDLARDLVGGFAVDVGDRDQRALLREADALRRRPFRRRLR